LNIRRLKEDDIDYVMEIMAKFPESYPREYLSSNKRGSIKWLLNYLLSPEDDYDGGSYVLVSWGSIIGHIAYIKDVRCFEGGVYELSAFVVDKDYQGKSFGKKMIEFAENMIRKLGGRIIWLQTESKMGYFEKLGYKEIAVFPNYWGKGRDRHIKFKAKRKYVLCNPKYTF
jgi:ribosomal protein S18 acetylase RimI-like enzyme